MSVVKLSSECGVFTASPLLWPIKIECAISGRDARLRYFASPVRVD